MPQVPIILASNSAARNSMLGNAGLCFAVMAANINEQKLQSKLNHLPADALALELAKAKALSISRDNPPSLVIGADQTLEFEGKIIHKAPDIETARVQLLALRGKTHKLNSAVVCVKADQMLFTHVSTAKMTMRNFSKAALDAYLDVAADEVLSSVGGYHYEGKGIQLFDHVEGDYYTILGLPLLPLLAFLRETSMIEV